MIHPAHLHQAPMKNTKCISLFQKTENVVFLSFFFIYVFALSCFITVLLLHVYPHRSIQKKKKKNLFVSLVMNSALLFNSVLFHSACNLPLA